MEFKSNSFKNLLKRVSSSAKRSKDASTDTDSDGSVSEKMSFRRTVQQDSRKYLVDNNKSAKDIDMKKSLKSSVKQAFFEVYTVELPQKEEFQAIRDLDNMGQNMVYRTLF